MRIHRLNHLSERTQFFIALGIFGVGVAAIIAAFIGFGSPGSMEGSEPQYASRVSYEAAVIQSVKRISPSVVSVIVKKNLPIIEQCAMSPFGNLPPEFQKFFQYSVPCERGTQLEEVGGGTGFIVSNNGLVVTNKHVVADLDAQYTVLTNEGKQYDAVVLDRDPAQDLAVLKIKASNLPVAPLADSDSLALGQSVITIGNALGEFRNTVSVGVVSGLSRNVVAGGLGQDNEMLEGVIQTDAAINRGNSGGPLVNLRGEVIGVNTAVVAGAQNIAFAIPINQVKRALDSLKRTGEIQEPYLGVQFVTLTKEMRALDVLPVEEGAILRGDATHPAVLPGSPADAAGLQAEDIILAVNDVPLTEEHTLSVAIRQHQVGEVIALKIWREGDISIAQVTLAKR